MAEIQAQNFFLLSVCIHMLLLFWEKNTIFLKAADYHAFAMLEPVLAPGFCLRTWGFKGKLNFPGTSLDSSTPCNSR